MLRSSYFALVATALLGLASVTTDALAGGVGFGAGGAHVGGAHGTFGHFHRGATQWGDFHFHRFDRHRSVSLPSRLALGRFFRTMIIHSTATIPLAENASLSVGQ